MEKVFEIPKASAGGEYPQREYVLVEQGLQHGVCIGVIDLGTHVEVFKGESKNMRKIEFVFEFPDQVIEIEKKGEPTGVFLPLVRHKTFTFSMSPKGHLRKFLESWTKKFPSDEAAEAASARVFSLIGKNAHINISHDQGTGNNADKVFENFASIAPLMKNFEVKEPQNQKIMFSVGAKDGQNSQIFENMMRENWQFLSKKTKDKIKASAEWQHINWLDVVEAPAAAPQQAAPIQKPSPVVQQKPQQVAQPKPQVAAKPQPEESDDLPF